MTDLVARLREAIDNEQVYAETADHLSRQDSVSLLRRCAVDRKILDAHGQEHDCIELTASGDASVVDGKPWALWETQDTEASGKPCFVIRALAEAYGVEA